MGWGWQRVFEGECSWLCNHAGLWMYHGAEQCFHQPHVVPQRGDRWVSLMNVGTNFIRGWLWGALNANVHHCVRLATVTRSVSIIHLLFVIVWLDNYGL